MSDSEIDADEAEIARIISRLPEFSWLTTAEIPKIKHEIRHKVAKTLHEYYLEKTRNAKTRWTVKFEESGITEDDGKSMISCARRLELDIS